MLKIYPKVAMMGDSLSEVTKGMHGFWKLISQDGLSSSVSLPALWPRAGFLTSQHLLNLSVK